MAEDSSTNNDSDVSGSGNSSTLSGSYSKIPATNVSQNVSLPLSYTPPSESNSVYARTIGQSRAGKNYFDAEQYQDVRNSSHLHDATSMRSVSSMSGSIMSNIDWDEVDKLIDDV